MGLVPEITPDDEVLQELGAFEEARQFIDQHGSSLIDSIALRSEAMAKQFPGRPAVIFEGQQLSWDELNAFANQFAHAMQRCGIESGDVVALMMENRIEFLACFIAISKLGAICSLINTNLVNEGLSHSCTVSNVHWFVFGEELDGVVAEFRTKPTVRSIDFLRVDDLGTGGCPDWAVDLSESANQASSHNLHCEPLAPGSLIFYIFTSGTTGLPKAVKITNRRYLGGAIAGWKMSLRSSENDRQYMALPLYHGVGITVGFGSTLYSGSMMFLRRKFSASRVLEEARQYGTNHLIYIGELCRYLMATPERPDDSENPITTMSGNGLRPDIWKPFKQRFGVSRICEFYGASEGNVSFFNALNRDETVGFPSSEVRLVRYDVALDRIERDGNGRCVSVEPGLPGLMISRIADGSPFEGYTDPKATESKIVRDAFEPGDAWFNSGDLLKEVDVGYAAGLPHFQFIDRVGDTFRWKGENVSTNEVAEVINGFPDVSVCNVYGVAVPGADGKAGMAAVQIDGPPERLDVEALFEHITARLPEFAWPRFLRVTARLETTGTMKLVKSRLQSEGFDPGQVSDPLFVYSAIQRKYVPLDQRLHEEIASGALRL